MQYAQKVMDYILRFHSEMEYLGLQAYKSAEEKERKIKALTAYSCKVKRESLKERWGGGMQD